MVADKYGERCAPAFVAATTTDDEFMIGAPAKERYPRDFLFTVTNNFQLLNAAELNAAQLSEARAHIVCALDEERLVYQLNNVKFEYETEITPHQVAVKLFENMYGEYDNDSATRNFVVRVAFGNGRLALASHGVWLGLVLLLLVMYGFHISRIFTDKIQIMHFCSYWVYHSLIVITIQRLLIN